MVERSKTTERHTLMRAIWYLDVYWILEENTAPRAERLLYQAGQEARNSGGLFDRHMAFRY